MTYDATLAELTSLEEMLRQLMEEGHIHEDVVAKLWQVYSKYQNVRTGDKADGVTPRFGAAVTSSTTTWGRYHPWDVGTRKAKRCRRSCRNTGEGRVG